MPDDPFDLERFATAQAPVYATALAELRAGRKRSHWMWFVFPQLRGLGSSTMATFYGIGSLDEARAYLAHAVLGPRLVECTQALLALGDGRLRDILGSIDAVKFGSSMTLFERASDGRAPVFRQALDRFCEGRRDDRTLAALDAGTN